MGSYAIGQSATEQLASRIVRQWDGEAVGKWRRGVVEKEAMGQKGSMTMK